MGNLAGSGRETTGHPVVVAVATCLEALDGIRSTPTLGLNATEIRLMLLALVHLTAALFALRLRLLVAGEVHRVHDLTGATSLPAFLSHLTRLPRAEASAQVRLARDLDRRWPLLADALAAGQINPDQLTIAVTALRRLPKDLTIEQTTAVQQCLIQAAQTMTGRRLKALGRRLWEVIDPDGADKRAGKDLEDEEELARAKAYFRSWRNGDGTTGFRGKLPDVQADMLLKALTALASPRRRTNPNIHTHQPDDNHPHRRDSADTGGTGPGDSDPGDSGPGDSGPGDSDAVGGHGGAGPDPDPASGHHAPPHDRAEPAEPDHRDDPGGLGDPDHRDDPGDPDPPPDPGDPGDPGDPDPAASGEGGPPHRSRLFDPDDPDPEERQTGRPVPYPVRLGHALMELLERLPADLLPATNGVGATIVVTIPLDQLQRGVGTATLDTGTEISHAQLRRLACEAGIVPAVLDGEGQPLDLGREQRLFTKGQRVAMGIRDKTCRAEGCDRPAAWLVAHHLTEWCKGGRTDIADGAMVCEYHHHLIHSTSWTHHLLPNGQIRFRRR